MLYQYVAYTLQEGVVKGRLEARTEDDARAELMERGYKPLSVARTLRLPDLDKVFPSLYQVKTGELVAFARQMATMIASGANLLRVLEMLQAETTGRGMRKVLARIHERVSEGEEFTAALREHPQVFDEVFVSLVEVGEYTGRLGPAMEQLAEIIAQAHEAKQRAIKSLMMPVFLIGTSFLMLGFMAFVALPPLLDTFESMDVEIPLMTQVMVGGVNFAVDNVLQILIGVVAVFAVYKLARRFARIKYVLDYAKAKMPLLGGLVLAAELGRFSRIMATLLSSEVELATALRLGLNSTKNEALRRAWDEADQALMSGHRMAEALSKRKIIPTMFVELVAIGEETNTLGRTMTELADSNLQTFEDRVSAILAIAEPVSTFAVGGVVLFMALSVMTPILSAANAVQ